ncbi:hypothetical protein YC2023_040931 [Brassica napus]
MKLAKVYIFKCLVEFQSLGSEGSEPGHPQTLICLPKKQRDLAKPKVIGKENLQTDNSDQNRKRNSLTTFEIERSVPERRGAKKKNE